METCYISLGSDCSVSYQLRRLGLQTRGSMPFDWMRIDNLQAVISILEAEYEGFARFESYTIKTQALAFDYFGSISSSRGVGDSSGDDNFGLKSQNRMTHTKYKFILPHEYQGDVINKDDFQEKYARRIKRFLEVGRSPALRKVFLRLGTSRERDASIQRKLDAALNKLGIVNYEVKYIILEECADLIPKNEPFRWQRDYIPWEKLFVS